MMTMRFHVLLLIPGRVLAELLRSIKFWPCNAVVVIIGPCRKVRRFILSSFVGLDGVFLRFWDVLQSYWCGNHCIRGPEPTLRGDVHDPIFLQLHG